MSEIVKVISTHIIEDKNWVEAYTSMREYEEIADDLGKDEKDRLKDYTEKLKEAGRAVLNTNNYVTFGELSDVSDAIVLIELDYTYTSQSVKITDIFEENEEQYVVLEKFS